MKKQTKAPKKSLNIQVNPKRVIVIILTVVVTVIFLAFTFVRIWYVKSGTRDEPNQRGRALLDDLHGKLDDQSRTNAELKGLQWLKALEDSDTAKLVDATGSDLGPYNKKLYDEEVNKLRPYMGSKWIPKLPAVSTHTEGTFSYIYILNAEGTTSDGKTVTLVLEINGDGETYHPMNIDWKVK
jgi:hypothetical protein